MSAGRDRFAPNTGDGNFEDATRKAGLDPSSSSRIGCTVGDYDNDGLTDLAVIPNGRVLLLHNEKDGSFKIVTDFSGIKSPGSKFGLAFIDYDHDGDLDLDATHYNDASQYDPRLRNAFTRGCSREGSATMWRNNGNGTFTDVTDSTGIGGDLAGSERGWYRLQQLYRAIDVVCQVGKNTAVFENPREGKFLLRDVWPSALAAPTAAIAVLDFDHDGWDTT